MKENDKLYFTKVKNFCSSEDTVENSLVVQLRSRMPSGMAKKQNKNKKTNKQKDTVKKMKTQATDWEKKMFEINILTKNFCSEYRRTFTIQ